MDYPISETDVNLYDDKFTDGDSELGIPASRDPASWANAVTDEFRNFFIAMGITPSETDVKQLMKSALTLAGHYFCTDGGAANDYDLTPAILDEPTEYYHGMTVVFEAANAPTGASVIAVGALADVALADGDGDALAGGEFATGDWVAAFYNFTTGQFELTDLSLPEKNNIGPIAADGGPYISSTQFDAQTELVAATWESVGPTDSGADNEWPALDLIPENVDWVLLGVECGISTGTAAGNAWNALYARKYGSSVGIDPSNMIGAAGDYIDSSGNGYAWGFTTRKVQVSSRMFDLRKNITNVTSAPLRVTLLECGYNRRR